MQRVDDLLRNDREAIGGKVFLADGNLPPKVQLANVPRAAALGLVPGPAWVEQDGRRIRILLVESPSPVEEVPPRAPIRRWETECLTLDAYGEDGLSPSQFRRVIESIRERISRTVTVTELARDAGLSVTYFSQRFKSSSGFSPHQYLLRLRICRAKELLEESESPVIDIAAACGFETQQHFARIFRRLTRQTPTEFRRQSQHSSLVSVYANLPYVND